MEIWTSNCHNWELFRSIRRTQISIMLRRASLALLLICPGFAQLTFEVASIKPANPDTPGSSIQFMPGGGLKMMNVPLRAMITFAYDVRDFQVSGGPGWVGTERFDVMARPEHAAAEGLEDLAKMTDDQRKTVRDQMAERLRALLADRFQLVVHKETKEQPIYALVVSKNGAKLKEAKAVAGARQGMSMNRGRVEGFAAPMEMLGQTLSNCHGTPGGGQNRPYRKIRLRPRVDAGCEPTPAHKASGMASTSQRRRLVVRRFSPRCRSSSGCGWNRKKVLYKT